MVQVHVERTIAASPERVFDWLTDPANLTAAPLFLKAGWANGSSGPGVGALREVTGVGMRFREKITAYDAPRSGLGARGRYADVYSVRRRHARRLGDHLHRSGSRGRQGDGGGQPAAVPLNLPRDPRWLREGAGELVAPIRESTV